MGPGQIIQLVGLVAALAAGVMGGFPQSALLVAVLGAVGGYFIADDKRMRFLVGVVALGVVSAGLNAIPAIGPYISAALGGGGLLALWQAAAVTVIVKAIVEHFMP